MNWQELKLYIRVLFTPGLWARSQRTCKYWDEILRDLLANYEPKSRDQYTIRLDNSVVWIENKWYGYGSKYHIDEAFPSRRTALLLSDKIKQHEKPKEPPQWYKDYKKVTPLEKVMK